jgi:hypothetical protein
MGLHADAMFALENMEGTYRTDMNPETLKAIVASRRELGARWPDIEADIEATKAAYSFREDLMDEDFREWDHDAEPIHPADWCREQRTVIHKLMRIAYSGGAQYALENLEYHREHVAAQLAYAMVDLFTELLRKRFCERVQGGTLSAREDEEATTMRDDETSRLPPGYSLDLVGDPCVIMLRRSDRTVVARFTHAADPEEIRRAAEEDTRARGGRQDD